VPELPITESPVTTIEEPDGSLEALASAVSEVDTAGVAGRYPSCLSAWASLGEHALRAGSPVEAYAYFRVGYHRGLDRIRKAGWRGSGRVPWSHAGNRGFLRSVKGLGEAAAALGESDEAERCATFLADLAPDFPSTG
jgi:Protein of unknown function (DUF3151)